MVLLARILKFCSCRLLLHTNIARIKPYMAENKHSVNGCYLDKSICSWYQWPNAPHDTWNRAYSVPGYAISASIIDSMN